METCICDTFAINSLGENAKFSILNDKIQPIVLEKKKIVFL